MSELKQTEQASVTRREFTLEAALAILGTCVITVSDACSKKSPTTPTTPVTDATATTISGNHGHAGTIAAAQITAGNAISVDIRGQATHPHTVAISAADLNNLKSRVAVTAMSSTDSGHNHMVTFTPA